MSKLKNLIVVFSFLTSTVFAAADIFDNISASIKSGDARQVSKYFGSNVDLTILSQEEVYSKAQAELVLKDFLSKNTPKSFTLVHRGLSKEGSKYAIGSMVTTQGITYRVYLFVKQSGRAEFIQEMRFEKE